MLRQLRSTPICTTAARKVGRHSQQARSRRSARRPHRPRSPGRLCRTRETRRPAGAAAAVPATPRRSPGVMSWICGPWSGSHAVVCDSHRAGFMR